MAARAIALRCPHCGGRDMYAGWFKARPRCPTCALKVERGEEGYRVGSYMFNLVGAELAFVALFGAIVIWRWPTPPWEALTWTAPVFMLLAPLLFYPFTKLLFLAFDLTFRPAQPGDFSP